MADKRQQEQETVTQEVQEDSEQGLCPELNIEGLERIRKLNNKLADLITEIYSPLCFPNFTNDIKEMRSPAGKILRTIDSFANISENDINSFVKSEQWEKLNQAASHLSRAMEQKKKEWEALEPFLLKEIKKPEYCGKPISALDYQGLLVDGGILKGSLWDKALTAAIEAMEEHARQIERQLPSSFARQNIAIIKRATDRIDNHFAYDFLNLESDGQMHYAEIRTGKDEENPLSVYYCIDYSDKNAEPIGYVAKHLLEIAYSTAKQQGGFVAWQDIFENLGKSGRISKHTREEWKKLFLTMRHADVTIKNTNEANSPDCNYDYIEINEPFFISYPIKGKRKGQIIDGICINPNYKPPLFKFAEKHGKQITRVPIGVYQVADMKLTEENAILHDYLISTVAAMIKRKITSRITYNTIFESIHISGQTERERKARERTVQKIDKILDAFKKCNWIKDYKNNLSAKSEYCIDVILNDAGKIEEKGV